MLFTIEEFINRLSLCYFCVVTDFIQVVKLVEWKKHSAWKLVSALGPSVNMPLTLKFHLQNRNSCSSLALGCLNAATIYIPRKWNRDHHFWCRFFLSFIFSISIITFSSSSFCRTFTPKCIKATSKKWKIHGLTFLIESWINPVNYMVQVRNI